MSLHSLFCPGLHSPSLAPSALTKCNDAVHPVDLKEDLLECNSVELSFALTRFIREVRRPNGDAYSPDSIFYLCLGIQQVPALAASPVCARTLCLDSCPFGLLGQYLFMQGRIENIFTDPLYSQFAAEVTEMLRIWRPKLSPSGRSLSSRFPASYCFKSARNSCNYAARTMVVVIVTVYLCLYRTFT